MGGSWPGDIDRRRHSSQVWRQGSPCPRRLVAIKVDHMGQPRMSPTHPCIANGERIIK